MADERFTLGQLGNVQINEAARIGRPELQTTVEVGQLLPVQAKVVREGFKVPPVEFNPSKEAFFLDNLEIINLKDEPRVVSQSVRAGTMLPRGTTVDLVLTPPTQIPVDIFEQPHLALANKKVFELNEGILSDPSIREKLLQHDRPDDLAPADRQQLTQKFAQAGIQIDDANANTSFASAFNTMRKALAFR